MAPSWMSGYVSDVAYTLGFYRELAPPFLNYVCAINGFVGLPARPLRYCELGCGRGYGTALLAAANPDIAFVGIDFNPTHIAEARSFASRAGIANVAFIESSFADAARSNDASPGELDIVAMHGVYTWVAPGIREDIHAFLRNRLVSGGVAYISYNTLPGWSAITPVQRLLREYAERSPGDSLARLAKGRDALKELADKSAAFTAQSPVLKSRLKAMETQDAQYLVHEFLHDHWEPLYVTEAMTALAEAKLTYVGSANIAENRLSFCVPLDLIDLVQAAPDPQLRELLKDYAINKQFRRDVYVKGPIRISGLEAELAYDRQAFALTAVSPTIPEKWRIPSGEASLKPEIVDTILKRLQSSPATAGELRAAGKAAGLGNSDIPAVLEILIHNNVLNPCRPDFARLDRRATERINATVLELALAGDTHRFLAAPVLGSAITASYFERIAMPLMTKANGADDVALARQTFERLGETGRRFFRDGKPLDLTDENLDEIAGIVRSIRESGLPRWRELGVLA